MNTLLFAYGSLLNAASAGRVLKREVAVGEFPVAFLSGYARTWTLRERIHSHHMRREVSAAFLDLEPAAGARCNGVLIPLSTTSLADLRVREKNYDARDVTASIQAPVALSIDTRILTFIGKPEFRVGPGARDVFVMRRYLDLLATACHSLGPDFTHDFDASTSPPPHPVLQGSYTFIDARQAKQV